MQTVEDYLGNSECEELREAGINPERITVRVESRNDGPTAMRNYDAVTLNVPAEYKKTVANHQVGMYRVYGYAPKAIKEALLGYW